MQPRQRRRYVLDLSDERFDPVLARIAVEFPEPYRIADALLEFALRGADVEPSGALVLVARRVAFLQARLDAAALLGETGRRLAEASRAQAGVLAEEIRSALIDEIADGRARAAEAAREAARLRGS